MVYLIILNMSNKQQFCGRDSFYRMKYLHQIADMCRRIPGQNYDKLMLYYSSQVVTIGKKTQCRMSPQMKRTVCKCCSAILQPGHTENNFYKIGRKQPDRLISVCKFCATEKSFNLRKGYSLWCENPESVIAVIDSSQTDSSKSSTEHQNNMNLGKRTKVTGNSKSDDGNSKRVKTDSATGSENKLSLPTGSKHLSCYQQQNNTIKKSPSDQDNLV